MVTKSTSPSAFDFSGSIPKHYDEYLGPMFFEPYAIEIADRIDPAAVHVALEIACGTGRVTRHLRKVLLPGTKLIASDISADMLAIAKEKLAMENIEWQIIDAQALPFDDNSIDLIVCSFGFMFVPDKSKALSEVYRVLSRNGMFLFTTWDKLETIGASHIYRSIAKNYLPESLPDIYNLPFSMNDTNDIRELLKNAGFSKISIEKVTQVSFCETAKHAAKGLSHGGTIYNEIMSRNPAWVEEISEKVEKELADKYGAAPMIAPMSAIVSQVAK